MLRRATRALLPRSIRTYVRDTFGEAIYGRRTYSQEGEDLLLDRLFGERDSPGIYVDVGAHHPHRFSNTHLLFRRGWRGINIDARPGSMLPFQRFRPKDVNLELGVSRSAGQLEYFHFEEPALNTFDRNLAAERVSGGWPLRRTSRIECLPLSVILERYLSALKSETIELLTVDVEGFDLEVLQSNDWSRFRPQVVVVELLSSNLAQAAASPASEFLEARGYSLFSKLVNSALFMSDVPARNSKAADVPASALPVR